jgi:hypothetical protein
LNEVVRFSRGAKTYCQTGEARGLFAEGRLAGTVADAHHPERKRVREDELPWVLVAVGDRGEGARVHVVHDELALTPSRANPLKIQFPSSRIARRLDFVGSGLNALAP